jgi:hypothetical protein
MIAEQLAEYALEHVGRQSVRLEQDLFGNLEMGDGAGGSVHGFP